MTCGTHVCFHALQAHFWPQHAAFFFFLKKAPARNLPTRALACTSRSEFSTAGCFLGVIPFLPCDPSLFCLLECFQESALQFMDFGVAFYRKNLRGAKRYPNREILTAICFHPCPALPVSHRGPCRKRASADSGGRYSSAQSRESDSKKSYCEWLLICSHHEMKPWEAIRLLGFRGE